MNNRGPVDRAVSPAVATLLLAAVVLVLGAAIGTQFLGLTSKIGGPTAQATFEYSESPVGIEMTPEHLAQDVIVEINGKQVAAFDSKDVGTSRFIPTSPGDRLTVVAADGSRSVFVSRTIDDRDRIGDFIAHYTFEEASGTTLVDRSGNENHGNFRGNPTWLSDDESGLAFDGSGDGVSVTDISSPVDVEEFTIAIAYRQESKIDVNKLVEHEYNTSENYEWYLETDVQSDNEYDMSFSVNYGEGERVTTDSVYDINQRRVVVGTYDGKNYDLYLNGNRLRDDSYEQPVGMGDMGIAYDPDSGVRDFEGEIYEIRLYYSAFGDEEVQSITTVMS